MADETKTKYVIESPSGATHVYSNRPANWDRMVGRKEVYRVEVPSGSSDATVSRAVSVYHKQGEEKAKQYWEQHGPKVARNARQISPGVTIYQGIPIRPQLEDLTDQQLERIKKQGGVVGSNARNILSERRAAGMPAQAQIMIPPGAFTPPPVERIPYGTREYGPEDVPSLIPYDEPVQRDEITTQEAYQRHVQATPFQPPQIVEFTGGMPRLRAAEYVEYAASPIISGAIKAGRETGYVVYTSEGSSASKVRAALGGAISSTPYLIPGAGQAMLAYRMGELGGEFITRPGEVSAAIGHEFGTEEGQIRFATGTAVLAGVPGIIGSMKMPEIKVGTFGEFMRASSTRIKARAQSISEITTPLNRLFRRQPEYKVTYTKSDLYVSPGEFRGLFSATKTPGSVDIRYAEFTIPKDTTLGRHIMTTKDLAVIGTGKKPVFARVSTLSLFKGKTGGLAYTDRGRIYYDPVKVKGSIGSRGVLEHEALHLAYPGFGEGSIEAFRGAGFGKQFKFYVEGIGPGRISAARTISSPAGRSMYRGMDWRLWETEGTLNSGGRRMSFLERSAVSEPEPGTLLGLSMARGTGARFGQTGISIFRRVGRARAGARGRVSEPLAFRVETPAVQGYESAIGRAVTENLKADFKISYGRPFRALGESALKFGTASRLRFASLMGQRTATRTRTGYIQKARGREEYMTGELSLASLDSRMRLGIGTITGQLGIQRTGQRTRLGQGQAFGQLSGSRFMPPGFPEPGGPGEVVGFPAVIPGARRAPRGRKKRRGPGRRYRYTPTLGASLFNIRGGRPSRVTGLEVRPLPRRRGRGR